MILPRKQAEAVATARKTRHRIPVGRLTKGPHQGSRFKIAYWTRDQDSRRTAEAVCWVEITHPPQHTTLHPLGRDDARAEGYDGARGPLNWVRAFLEAHDRAWIAKHQHDGETGITDEQITGRFREHWAGTTVNLLRWRLCEQPDQYMAPVSGTTTSRHRSIDPDTPHCPPNDLHVKRARELGEQQRASFRKDLETERARRKAERIPMLREQAQRRKNAA